MKLRAIIARTISHLHKAYGLDARSLALFRILVAVVVLVDLALRLQHAVTFYSDSGATSRSLAISVLNPDRWSLLFLNGSSEFVTAVLLMGVVAAFMMMVGMRTRAATIVLWVILVSVQARNNHVLSGADTLIRMSVFWSMFLPLGTRWSFDASRFRIRDTSPSSASVRVSSVATFGLILQAACLYLFTAIQKTGPRWHEEGTAVYYALGARDLSNSLGNWLFHTAPNFFFQISTFGTLVLEYAVPLLLLLPIRSGWLRGLGVAGIVALQLGIATTMTVGLFPAIAIASATAIIPSGVWKFLESRVLSRERIVSLGVRWNSALESLWPRNQTSPESTPTPGADVPVESHIVRFLPQGWLGVRPKKQAVVNVVCALAVTLVVMWNVSTVSSYQMPDTARRVAVATGLYQDWSMFAPTPQGSTVWFVAEGTLSSGEEVDVLLPLVESDVSIREAPVYDQSDQMVIEDKYWRKYLHAIRDRDGDLLAFAGYACRTWNAEHTGQDRLESLTLTRSYAVTLPNSERAEPAHSLVGSWNCN